MRALVNAENAGRENARVCDAWEGTMDYRGGGTW